jgi:hypothetical protein
MKSGAAASINAAAFAKASDSWRKTVYDSCTILKRTVMGKT